jgi:hypothetical protein
MAGRLRITRSSPLGAAVKDKYDCAQGMILHPQLELGAALHISSDKWGQPLERGHFRDGDQRMLKYRNAELVLGALFATLLWAGMWGWYDSYALTEKQKDECYETTKKTGQKSDECKTFLERTTSDPIAFFTLVLAVSTVGLWVATLFLYYAGEKQIAIAKTSADAARDQVKLSREALISTERAFIFLKEFKWEFVGTKDTYKIHTWKFVPILENVGNTPTKHMTNYVNYQACLNRLDLSFGFPDFGGEVGRTTIGPKKIMHASHINISVDILSKVKSGEAHAYIWIWADYNDVFENTPRHRSEFCAEIIVHGDPMAENCTFFFRQWGPFNGADEECYRKPKDYPPT